MPAPRWCASSTNTSAERGSYAPPTQVTMSAGTHGLMASTPGTARRENLSQYVGSHLRCHLVLRPPATFRLSHAMSSSSSLTVGVISYTQGAVSCQPTVRDLLGSSLHDSDADRLLLRVVEWSPELHRVGKPVG